jgi:hypothetical protein
MWEIDTSVLKVPAAFAFSIVEAPKDQSSKLLSKVGTV